MHRGLSVITSCSCHKTVSEHGMNREISCLLLNELLVGLFWCTRFCDCINPTMCLIILMSTSVFKYFLSLKTPKGF